MEKKDYAVWSFKLAIASVFITFLFWLLMLIAAEPLVEGVYPLFFLGFGFITAILAIIFGIKGRAYAPGRLGIVIGIIKIPVIVIESPIVLFIGLKAGHGNFSLAGTNDLIIIMLFLIISFIVFLWGIFYLNKIQKQINQK